MTTLDDLIAVLENYREELGGDAEVRLMTQENYPFENGIAGVTTNSEIMDEDEDEDEGGEEAEEVDEPIVYICEGGQIGYGMRAAWGACHF